MRNFKNRGLLVLVGSLLCTLGCFPSVPVPFEQRSIAYEDASLSRSFVEFEKNGVTEKKLFFSVDWNLRANNPQSTLEALNSCLAALRSKDKSLLARGAGVRELNADYVAILVYRAKEQEIGDYELGLVVRMDDLFSNLNGNELLEIGRSTNKPVGLKDNRWDFTWKKDQVAKLYQELNE